MRKNHQPRSHLLRNWKATGLVRELGVAFGASTAAVTAIQGFEAAASAVTWSLMAGALACGILSLRAARPSESVAVTTPVDAR